VQDLHTIILYAASKKYIFLAAERAFAAAPRASPRRISFSDVGGKMPMPNRGQLQAID
jgi:hypothetical protein